MIKVLSLTDIESDEECHVPGICAPDEPSQSLHLLAFHPGPVPAWRPDSRTAAANARYNSFATTDAGAGTLLPRTYWNNPQIFPTDAILTKSEFFQRLSPDNERHRNLVFYKVLHWSRFHMRRSSPLGGLQVQAGPHTSAERNCHEAAR